MVDTKFPGYFVIIIFFFFIECEAKEAKQAMMRTIQQN